jgi:acetyl esterase/lipase
MPGATGTNGDNEVVHDFSPLLLVYRSGRLERPLIMPFDLPGHDAATGVESKDVPLSPSTFVRLYLPPDATSSGDDGGEKKKANKLPVVVYFHGGGFVMGSAGSCVYHRFVNDLVAACPAVAVSVDYRLAPEHMLPAAYEDSLAALKWVLSATDTWLATHGDLGRVFLVGDSAGGNICHHLAMHPDVKQGAGLRGVVLIHPWFWGKEPIGGEQEHRRPRAKRAEAEGRGRKKHLWEFVCPGAVDGVDDPRMNPTAPGAPGLESLACEKVMVCVAEGDHLRWRGKAYAEAVAQAKKGVARAELLADTAAVEMLESEGVGHVFFLLDPEMEEAKELLGRIAAFVRAK